LLFIAYGGKQLLPLFADSIKVNSGAFFLDSLVLIRPIAGKLSDRYGETFAIIPALVITISALLVLSFSTNLFRVIMEGLVQMRV
jgi:nitrate/nitrite transporter NarK